MSPLDKAAAESDRPDHGPMGAYDAWPALTAESMCILGAWESRFQIPVRHSRRTCTKASTVNRASSTVSIAAIDDAPVRIAMRGACMRESVGGGAFAEMIIGTLFGFRPQADQELSLFEADTDRGFEGKLLNVSFDGKLLDISSDSDGVSYRFQDE